MPLAAHFRMLLLQRSSFVASLSIASIISETPIKQPSKQRNIVDDASCWRALVDRNILKTNDSMAGPLVRLAFHDATTGYPNASIRFELERPENRGLTQPLQLLTDLWLSDFMTQHKQTTLSFADAIALAGSTAIHHAGGPFIPIRVGRKDASEADPATLSRSSLNFNNMSSQQVQYLTQSMPSAGLNSEGLRRYFSRLGLRQEEWVALCGVHGMGRHVSLLGMSKTCLRKLTKNCLENAPVRLPFVTSSVDQFDNRYFQYLLRWYHREIDTLGEIAFIPTDVALVVDPGLRSHVERFSVHPDTYATTFARAYQKLVERGAKSAVRC